MKHFTLTKYAEEAEFICEPPDGYFSLHISSLVRIISIFLMQQTVILLLGHCLDQRILPFLG